VRVIIACFGNVLRADDGFGIAVAERLLTEPVPDGVEVLEVGIGGIALVQQLLDPADALIVVDAVDLGRPPGTVVVMDPDIPDLSGLSVEARRDALADMHLATPERTFAMADGMGVLPPVRRVVGCQAADAERYEQGLSTAVAHAVDVAVDEVRRCVRDLGIGWDVPPRRHGTG
jgi:hydrogenase maturation protease